MDVVWLHGKFLGRYFACPLLLLFLLAVFVHVFLRMSRVFVLVPYIPLLILSQSLRTILTVARMRIDRSEQMHSERVYLFTSSSKIQR